MKKTRRKKIIIFFVFLALFFIITGIVFKAISIKTKNTTKDEQIKKAETPKEYYGNKTKNMIFKIKNNLKDKVSSERLLKYSNILDQYFIEIMKYYDIENIEYSDTRRFYDLYNHLMDLEKCSENFSDASIYTFFELTIPVQLYNYSSEEPILPPYSYTKYKFEDISDITLTYYIDRGFNYSPLIAVRELENDFLLTEKYNKFKENIKIIEKMLTKETYNNKTYLMSRYFYSYSDNEPNWTSGMAQGEILGIIAKAYYLTKDKYYYDLGTSLIAPFYISYEDGGLIYEDPKTELPFLLEYAKDPKDRVLNGSIIGAIGLRNWYMATKEEYALKLYRNFIQEILYVLPEYDYKMENLPQNTSWSKYSLTTYPVQKGYQGVHINLLSTLLNDSLIKDLKYFNRVKYYLERWSGAYKFLYPNEDISNLTDDNINDIFN